MLRVGAAFSADERYKNMLRITIQPLVALLGSSSSSSASAYGSSSEAVVYAAQAVATPPPPTSTNASSADTALSPHPFFPLMCCSFFGD